MESFAQLYDRHFAEIYRYVFCRVREQSAAEDVTSEVFLKALRSFSSYQDRGLPFSCWLYRIASNQISDYFSSRREWLDVDSVSQRASEDCLLESVVRSDESRNIWEAVDRLPEGQRLAMYLRYAQDLPLAGIACVMDRSEAAVKLLIHRAVQRLRLELKPLAA